MLHLLSCAAPSVVQDARVPCAADLVYVLGNVQRHARYKTKVSRCLPRSCPGPRHDVFSIVPKGTARRLAGKCINPKVALPFAKGQQAVWLCRAGRATQFRTSRATRTLRSANLETLNEQFKGIFEAHGPVPTRGLRATRRFALGAVFVYQLTLWYRHEHDLDLRVGLEPFLKAA